jgi:DNA invertase Pin-like site-specific DNA recombinase
VSYVLYLRQSQDITGEGVAVERQRTECIAYAKAHNIELAKEPTTDGKVKYVEYVDNDKSATKGVRPEYQRLLKDIESGRVAGVMAWDLDRLHRQPMELETFINLANSRNIKLATVTGEADLSTDNGKLYARIKGAVARAEQERKAARQLATNRQLAKAGDLQPRDRPFGWRRTAVRVNGKDRPLYVELDEREAPAIRAAVDAILSGQSALSIYKRWNADRLLTSKGNLWTNDSFRKMLLRERNAGLQTYNGITTRATCKAIITVDELSELRAITASRVRQTHGERRSGLSGVPRCTCGHRMYRRDGAKATYLCSNPGKPSHNGISARILDKAMADSLRFTVAQRSPEEGVQAVLEEIGETRARLAELDAQDEDIMASPVTVKARLALLSETKAERDGLEAQLAYLASRNRLASLLDGVAPQIPGRAVFDRHAEVGKRLEALPVHDLYDLADALLSVVVHPLPGPRKGRMASSEIVHRIEINGQRL